METQIKSKLRRQKINVMLNEEERMIVTEKAIKYGYGDCLAEYIRAACIYENIYIEDVKGKTEVCESVSGFIEILHEILKEQKVILKSLLLSSNDVEIINKQNIQIIEMIDNLSKLIVSILSVNTEKRIQQRLNMLDKYSIDSNLLLKITNGINDIIVIRPSNLHVPNHKISHIVFLKDYCLEFDLNNICIQKFSQNVNELREKAMQKKMLLAFKRVEDKLRIGIIMDFKDIMAAKKFAYEINTNDIYCLSDTKLVGDNNSSNC